MGTHKRLYKFRKFLMYLWMMILPITLNWMSPVLIIMGGFEGYITLSFIIFAIWFISSLFIGRAYCAYGCQWGAAQEVLGDVVPKQLDPNKKGRNRKIKYPIFVLWIAFIILGPIMTAGYINGLNIFFPGEPGDPLSLVSFDPSAIGQLIFYFGILSTVVVLFTLVGGKRAFCAYACPMGVLGIIGTKIKNFFKYPSLHLEADIEKCTQCKQCSKACVMSLDVNELFKEGNMYDPDCILCGSCISHCPQKVISYAWKWKKTKNSHKEEPIKEALEIRKPLQQI